MLLCFSTVCSRKISLVGSNVFNKVASVKPVFMLPFPILAFTKKDSILAGVQRRFGCTPKKCLNLPQTAHLVLHGLNWSANWSVSTDISQGT